jgi:hypothetical protein
MQALNQLAPEVGLAPACAALNLNRSSVYREDARRRHLAPVPVTRVPRPSAPLAFSTNERQQLLEVLILRAVKFSALNLAKIVVNKR